MRESKFPQIYKKFSRASEEKMGKARNKKLPRIKFDFKKVLKIFCFEF